MNNVAIIPARGGSKRIPRKNIKMFSGKPMIAYSIEAALKSKLFNRVIVSTDDEEIADVAIHYGAEVPFIRPETLSGDYTGTIEVIAHAIDWLQEQDDVPSGICCIYATAPFLQDEDLKKGLKTFNTGSWQYVFSATTFAFPIFRGFEKNSEQGLKMFFPEHFQTRSQDLPEAMHDAGQFYWGRPEAWCDGLDIFAQGSTVVELPRWRVQDIDNLDDWQRAEIIYNLIQELQILK
jgi:pseudaminic acid cytidylyltransferase